MGFKTYKCVICGKEGITKPQSYAYDSGRACRCHQGAQDAKNAREVKEKDKKYLENIVQGIIKNNSMFDPQFKFKHLSEYSEKNFMMNVAEIFPKLTTYNCNATIEEIYKSIDIMVTSGFIDNEFHYYFDLVIDRIRSFIKQKEDLSPFTREEIKLLKDDICSICDKYNEDVLELNNNFKTSEEMKKKMLESCIQYKKSLSDFFKKYPLKRKTVDDVGKEEIEEWIKINGELYESFSKIVSAYAGSSEWFNLSHEAEISNLILTIKMILASSSGRFQRYKKEGIGISSINELIEKEKIEKVSK